MLTILSLDGNDFNELTRSYMGFFHSPEFEQFLNTTQTGYAHESAGIEFSLLVRTLSTSLCFCTAQLIFFCFLRPIFKFLYQPRCYCVPINERMDPLPDGMLTWVLPTFTYSINYYLSMGLDAYFFVRFVSILLLFFIVIGSLNMIVLIPINWTGGSGDYSASGLDKLSLSNISISEVQRLNAHFFMCIVTVGFFHWLIIYEFQSFVKIRQSYLLSSSHSDSIISRTILVDNVPPHLQDVDILADLFESVPGGIKTIWFLYDFKEVMQEVVEAQDALELLELSQIIYLKRYIRKNFKASGRVHLRLNTKKIQDVSNEKEPHKEDESLRPLFYPPIYFRAFSMLGRNLTFKLPGYMRILRLERRVSMIDWCIQTLQDKHKAIDTQKVLLTMDKLPKHNKLFLEFNTQNGASIAHQCLLSQSQFNLDLTLMEVHPGDILWNNLSRNNVLFCIIEKYFVNVLFICIIILYVIPVSFIGLVSQLPLLTQLMPFLLWIYRFPEVIRQTISSFLPSVLLSVLTETVMITFRFLTYFKGEMSGSDSELDLQLWYFAFLFVQQFLVVTILSSITVIFKQIVDQPTSIPILLATNLPKAANFFFQYIALKAFAFCGSNFLRIDQLIAHYTIHKIIDKTPRQKFFRLTSLPKIKWGTIYPVYSVYASIGLAYSIISPLITIFIIFILSLVLLYYKYALKYIYNHVNVSETQGRLYPVALLHLYTGIYCLECCLIGIFFLLKNELGSCPMKIQGWFMICVLLATIFSHIAIYNRYSKHFTRLPILQDKKFKNPNTVENLKTALALERKRPYTTTKEVNQYYLNQNLLYFHPAFKYERPKLWLPDDPLGISESQIRAIESKGILEGGETRGVTLNFNKSISCINIKISEAPPDYK
ncbi:uncharacterized protein PRCAT00000505001 [Priceomyces carsonii]|uniref:uncharacterized protein n=1 Tax=Priceomyces carsonii TaxID=28549 RepID=UPI002ED7E8F5|nr:unnamed protein product [Priceomyces carsonii]